MSRRLTLFLAFLFTHLHCQSDPFLKFIENYQREETQYNGHKCSFYPTCSEYAKISYKSYGLLGIFLTIERMFIREFGNLETKFKKVPHTISAHPRYYDPVSNSFQKPSFLQEDF